MKIAIVCTAGGAKCVSLVGYLEELIPRLARHYPFPVFDYFGAVSGTAVTASTLMGADNLNEYMDGLARASNIWSEIDKGGPDYLFPFPKTVGGFLFSKNVHPFRGDGFLNNDSLYRVMSTFDPEKAVRGKTEIHFSVYDHNEPVKAKKYKVLSNKHAMFDPRRGGNPELLRDALVGSASITYVFPRVRVGNHLFADGDHLRAVPIVQAGYDLIFVLHTYPDPRQGAPDLALDITAVIREFLAHHKRLPSLPGSLMNLIEKYQTLQHKDSKELEHAETLAELMRAEKKIAELEQLLEISQTKDEATVLEALRGLARTLKNKVLGSERQIDSPFASPQIIRIYTDFSRKTRHLYDAFGSTRWRPGTIMNFKSLATQSLKHTVDQHPLMKQLGI